MDLDIPPLTLYIPYLFLFLDAVATDRTDVRLYKENKLYIEYIIYITPLCLYSFELICLGRVGNASPLTHPDCAVKPHGKILVGEQAESVLHYLRTGAAVSVNGIRGMKKDAGERLLPTW
jgi:hypothetical protein